MYSTKNCEISILPFYIYYTDGQKLDGDLYIPQYREPLPVVLMRTPYMKKNFFALFDAVAVARLGFVVAVQNVRGRYESDGIFDPFINERNDSVLTVQWLRQQLWCNGQVFSIGVSYEGFTAMMCSNDTKLIALASIVSSSNIRDTWFFEGGAIRQAFVQAWAHGFAFTDTNSLSADEKEYIQYLANDIEVLYKLPIREFPAGKYLPYYSSWVSSEDNEYWDLLANRTSNKLNRVNGYYLGGWYDIFCEGTIADYQNAIQDTDKTQRLVIGPWSHNELFSSLVGEIDFGLYTLRDIDQYDIFKWFSCISQNKQAKSGVSIYVMGKNKWREFSAWPPPYIRKRLYLSSSVSARSVSGDGLLSWEAASDLGADEFYHIKSNPVPSIGGRSLDAATSITGKGGPRDQRSIESREDVLVYTSEYLPKEVTIIGLVSALLNVSSSQVSTVFHVKFVDVYPDGRAINILDSCKKIDFKSDTKQELKVILGSTAYTFLEGHRIRCEISSSGFPRISIHEGLLLQDARQKVFWGNTESTWIELPVAEL